MKLQTGVEFLKGLGCTVPQHQPRTGWVLSDCPLGPWNHTAGKSSAKVFGLRLSDGHCKCFACDWTGNVEELVGELHARSKPTLFSKSATQPLIAIDYKAITELLTGFDAEPEWPTLDLKLSNPKASLHVFPEEWLESFPEALSVGWALKYLHKRQVPPQLALDLDLRADTKQHRVCFPVRDFKKRLVGLHGRAVEGGVDPRYRMYLHDKKNNQIAWLGESWVDLSQPIVVVEGPFDLASVRRVYANVVSPLFSNPSYDKIKRMAPASTWITFYDRGTGGDHGREKVDKAIGGDHVVHHLLPPEGVKDPGEMSAQEIYETLNNVLPDSAFSID